MCILFIYTNPNPSRDGFRLIIASNRDEFYKRPAKNAYLCPETGIIGGRDMTEGREGGMWLGAAVKPPKISFAALLNVTGEEKITESVLPRGPIVFNYLKNDTTATSYLKSLQPPKVYNAFNVVAIELTRDSCEIFHHSNSPEATHEFSGRQILAFGNSTPLTPLKKVTDGRGIFEETIARSTHKQELIDGLLMLLKNKEKHLPDPELERRAPGGFKELSSIFVEIATAYGTRTHSVVLVDYDWNLEFIEHTMKAPIDVSNPQWDVTVIKSQL